MLQNWAVLTKTPLTHLDPDGEDDRRKTDQSCSQQVRVRVKERCQSKYTNNCFMNVCSCDLLQQGGHVPGYHPHHAHGAEDGEAGGQICRQFPCFVVQPIVNTAWNAASLSSVYLCSTNLYTWPVCTTVCTGSAHTTQPPHLQLPHPVSRLAPEPGQARARRRCSKSQDQSQAGRRTG